MTSVEEEDVCGHDGPDQQGYCKLGDAMTPWLSNHCRSRLPHQTAGQCEEQIL